MKHARLVGLLASILVACGGHSDGFPTDGELLAAHPDGVLTSKLAWADPVFSPADTRITAWGVIVPYGPERDDGSRAARPQGFWVNRYVLEQHLKREADGSVTVRGPSSHTVLDENGVVTTDREVESYPVASAGSYLDGKRTGEWTFWRQDGSLRAKGRFENDRRVAPWEAWNADGTVDTALAGEYEDDARVGE